MSTSAIRFRDDPWQRLPWLLPLALLVTTLSQMGFLLLLRQPSTPTPVQPMPPYQKPRFLVSTAREQSTRPSSTPSSARS